MNQSNYSNDYDPDNPPDLGYSLPAKVYVKGKDTNFYEEPPEIDYDSYINHKKDKRS